MGILFRLGFKLRALTGILDRVINIRIDSKIVTKEYVKTKFQLRNTIKAFLMDKMYLMIHLSPFLTFFFHYFYIEYIKLNKLLFIN